MRTVDAHAIGMNILSSIHSLTLIVVVACVTLDLRQFVENLRAAPPPWTARVVARALREVGVLRLASTTGLLLSCVWPTNSVLSWGSSGLVLAYVLTTFGPSKSGPSTAR